MGNRRWAGGQGLSPRVRGNLPPFPPPGGGAGSIPACAGEPQVGSSGGQVGRVYPRVCGGTGGQFRPRGRANGLSPRVRGNPGGQKARAGGQGSIPACAGEPSRSATWACIQTVYPRVCGGTPRYSGDNAVPGGLSPRVRGNLDGWYGAAAARWSIPACAGEPACRSAAILAWRVYPRVCGGTGEGGDGDRGYEGLSPRVRGNHRGDDPPRIGAGSIPACAGEPPGCRWRAGGSEVYPRVCGGTLVPLRY